MVLITKQENFYVSPQTRNNNKKVPMSSREDHCRDRESAANAGWAEEDAGKCADRVLARATEVASTGCGTG